GSPLQRLNRRYTELLVKVLKEGMASGEIRNDLPVNLLRDMIFGGIEHYAWPYLCGHGKLDIDRIANQISDLLWQG
ncbi:MAG: TetR/AcrR family transcriptional regulator C-terminal domain-containing protein, partial [Nevskiales bacterium]